ncbi:MAG: DcaP family trimeric outer membrane transporter, partial [Acidobacteriota bacterium]
LSQRLEQQAGRIEELEARLAEAPAGEAPIEDKQGRPAAVTVAETETVESTTRQPLGRFPDDAIVTAGTFDGAISIPGSDASVRIGGFVRAEGNYDFDSLGFQDTVSPRRIPLDGSVQDGANQSRFHVRNSRLNIDYRKSTSRGPLRAFVELDFFGGGTEFISGYEARIRHVAAQIGNLYVGQWWSQFADIQSSPEGADFGGPMGSPAARNAGIRWAQDAGDDWRWGIGLENPAGDLEGPDILLASDSVPNVTGYVQVSKPWGRLRLSGLGLQLDSTTDEALGGGLSFSGRLNLPAFGPRDNISFSAQVGSGFTHYYSAYSGIGLEGVVDASGRIETTDIRGGFIAFQHWWTETLRSTIQASAFDFDAASGADPDAFNGGRRYAVNLFWSPVNDVAFGLEYIYASQETVGGDEGSGSRLHGMARVDF